MKVTPVSLRPVWLVSFFPLVVLLASVLAAARAGSPPPGFAGVLIERGYLPEARPNAFAVGFSNGVSLCFDPVRGGVNYLWTGGFIDVASIRPGMGKTVGAVTLLGEVVYRERSEVPWRVGSPHHLPVVKFIGYAIGDDRIEFSYTIDRVRVDEEIRLRAEGGVERRFTFSGDPVSVWYVPGPYEGAVEIAGARPDADGYRVTEGGARSLVVAVATGRASQ